MPSKKVTTKKVPSKKVPSCSIRPLASNGKRKRNDDVEENPTESTHFISTPEVVLMDETYISENVVLATEEQGQNPVVLASEEQGQNPVVLAGEEQGQAPVHPPQQKDENSGHHSGWNWIRFIHFSTKNLNPPVRSWNH